MRTRQSGMSLVEIMVAVMIGLIGILIISQAYISGDNFNRSTLGEGGAQTGGLIALYSVERDARMAGYGIANATALGCGNIQWHYNGAYSANLGGTLPNIRLAPVNITTTAGQPDQLTIMYSTTRRQIVPVNITGFSKTTSSVTVDGYAGFANPVGDLALLAGATGCMLVKITDAAGITQNLQMLPGGLNPQNPPIGLGSFTAAFANGDVILNLGNAVVRTYSITNFTTDQTPTLQLSDPLLAAAGVAAQDLVEGIVDLKAVYGKDNGAGGGAAGDGVVDEWNATLPASAAEWSQVLGLKVAILARIGVYEKPTAAGACNATTAMPTWSGSAAPISRPFVLPEGLPSCYRYRVFETTVPLRNMIWRL
jgi:type IV pilus assembly protein PilW